MCEILGGEIMEQELKEKVKYLAKKDPEKMVEFVEHMYKHDPKAVERMIHGHAGKDSHLSSKAQYQELVEKLKWANDQGKGERWGVDDIKQRSRVNFDNSDYTEFDFAYLVNMLYAICCKEMTDISYFIKMAKCFLEYNKDENLKLYKGAFMQHQKHNMRGTQGYYNEYDEYDEYDRYDEEDRRGRKRHYRYANDNDYYNENESRRYRNEYEPYGNDSNYKENNMGFRR